MQSRRVYLGVLVVCAAALNAWLLQTGDPRGALAGMSFAAVCLGFSFFLPLMRNRTPVLVTSRTPRRPVTSASADGTDRAPAAQIVNAFSIDLEDYFHTEVSSRDVDFEQWDRMPSRVECSVHKMLDLLDEQHVRATVFVLGWVAERYPHLIREVAERGHEIACHSYRHKRVDQLTPGLFREDTRKAKQAIEDATGRRVEGYRAPSFSIVPGTEWAYEVLEELEFLYDSSVHPVWHATYSNARAPRFPYFAAGTGVLEIPISTWRAGGVNLPVGGGAYLRLLPYWYVQHGLHVVNCRERQPVTLYVHPWEIDYLQPAIQSGWASHARQLWGTRTMESKLRALLANMPFAPIAEVYGARIAASAPEAAGDAEPVPLFARVS
jgi:polysaccharide deacetylase family protein (PEP-CTERM system associated)